jgi:transposase
VSRSIGLDVHRDFSQIAIADRGRARSAGRIATTPEQLELFAQSLAPTDRVVREATGNALAIARILGAHVAEVMLAHAKQVRAISHAQVKIDAEVVADLLAADLIPRVWIGNERTRMLRRLVSRRRGAPHAGQERDQCGDASQPQGPESGQQPVRLASPSSSCPSMSV